MQATRIKQEVPSIFPAAANGEISLKIIKAKFSIMVQEEW